MQGSGNMPTLAEVLERETGIRTSPVTKQVSKGYTIDPDDAAYLEGLKEPTTVEQTSGLETVAQAQLVRQATVEQRALKDNLGFWEGVGLHASGTTTAAFGRQALQYLDGNMEEPVDGFTPSLEDYHAVTKLYGLQTSEYNRKRLMQANSPAQLDRYAREIKSAQDATALAGDRWITGIFVHGLDPVENLALIGTTALTGGGGAALGAPLRFQRVAHAVMSGGALVGTQVAAEKFAGGAETTLESALLTLGISFPLVYGLNRSLMLQYTKRQEVREARRALDQHEAAGLRGTPPEGALQRAAAGLDTPPRLRQQAAITQARSAVQTLRQTVRTLSSAGAWRAHLPETVRETSESIPAMLRDVQNTIADTRQLIKDAGGASKAPEAAAELKVLRQRARELDQPESVAVSRQAGITPTEYNAMVQEAKAAHTQALQQARAALKVEERALKALEDAPPPRTDSDNLLTEVDVAQQAIAPSITSDIADAVQAAERAILETGASPEAAARLTQQALEVGRAQLLGRNADAGNVAKGIRYFTELVSEHAKITGGIPALEKFVARVVDDPLQRSGLVGESASSNFAVFQRQTNRDLAAWDDAISDAVHEGLGVSKWKTMFGYNQRYLKARDALEDTVASDLLRRESQVLRGETVTASPDSRVAKLVDQAEQLQHRVADRARNAGLKGFEDYMFSAGYFHRSWNWQKMHRILQGDTSGAVVEALTVGMRRAVPGMSQEEAVATARAIIVRTKNKAQDARTDAMGQIGALEIDSMRQMLNDADVSEVLTESIMRRLEQRSSDQGSVKYAKGRIPIDMTVRFKTSSGESLRLQDLIDTDLTRLFHNYGQGMSGRSALAKVGIGGDTHGIQTHVQKYAELLDAQPGLSAQHKQTMRDTYTNILSDFTGIRKDGQVLGEGGQVLKALATASMLGATGLLQIPEAAIGMARHGAVSTMQHMFRTMPGIKHLMRDVANDKALLDNWFEMTGIDFKTDLRFESWKRQVEMGFPTDGAAIRMATLMQQMTPTVTGQRWVHSLQSDAFLKLHLHTLYKASTGDAKALRNISEAGDMLTPDMLALIRDNATLVGGKLNSLNIERLPHRVQDAVMQQMTRLQDTILLHQRPGFGTSYRHSAVGQLIGQFTSYVGMAHNVIMRRTWEHEGAAGIAKVMAYQYPMMLMTVYLNEARKGNVLDLESEDSLKELAARALGYSAVIGMYGDLVGTLLGGQTRSLAAFGPTEAPGKLVKGLGYFADGEYGSGAASTLAAMRAMSILGAMPGTQVLQSALQDD